MKSTIAAFSLLLGTMAYAQTGRVGVNTHEPKAAMDINAITADNAKGILIPRLNATLVKNITPSLTADQHSMLAFITEEISTSERAGNYELISGAGYYYWEWNSNLNDSRWVRVSGKFETDLRRVGNSNHITMDAGVGGTGTSAGTGESNVAIGKGSLNAITTGSNNVAVGLNALNKVTTESALIAIGQNALRDNTGANNTAIGSHALLSNTTGTGNMAFGTNALRNNTTGFNNVSLGTNSLYSNKIGNNNVAIGLRALHENTAGNNVAVGPESLSKNTTGQNNLAVGPDTLKENIIGERNIALGFEALRRNTSSHNIAIGTSSMVNNNDGTRNIGIGNSSLQNHTSGIRNIAIGYQALMTLTEGRNNIVIGDQAGRNLLKGSGNVFIGNDYSYDTVGGLNNAILIGNSITTDYSQIRNNSIILGDNRQPTDAGLKVGIGTYQPKEKVDVEGVIRAHTNANIGGSLELANHSKDSVDGRLASRWRIMNLGKQIDNQNKYTNSLQFWNYGNKTDGESTDNLSKMMLTDEGKLAIGVPSDYEPKERLEVIGGIKIGTTATTCTNETKGTLRFEEVKKKFQGCNGTYWVDLHP